MLEKSQIILGSILFQWLVLIRNDTWFVINVRTGGN